MGKINGGIAQKNNAASGTYTRGGNNEANYAGVASGQGIDWDTTAMGAGEYAGVWQDSPLGIPATYGMILADAARRGEEYGFSAFDSGESSVGNEGQATIIQQMGPDVMENAWHYAINGYGSAREYLEIHCAYPSAIELILEAMGDELDSED